jgi:hypothetical protein
MTMLTLLSAALLAGGLGNSGAVVLDWQSPVEQLVYEPTATPRGADCLPIASEAKGSCILATLDVATGTLHLALFDQRGSESHRLDHVCLPSRHGQARIAVWRVGDGSPSVVLVRLEGDTGTETSQELLLGLVPKKPKLTAVLLESISYRLGKGDVKELTARPRFVDSEEGAKILLHYTYTLTRVGKARTTVSWDDDLSWNIAAGRFVLSRRTGGDDAPLETLRAIDRSRELVSKDDIHTLCPHPTDFLTRTGIMELLPHGW